MSGENLQMRKMLVLTGGTSEKAFKSRLGKIVSREFRAPRHELGPRTGAGAERGDAHTLGRKARGCNASLNDST